MSLKKKKSQSVVCEMSFQGGQQEQIKIMLKHVIHYSQHGRNVVDNFFTFILLFFGNMSPKGKE